MCPWLRFGRWHCVLFGGPCASQRGLSAWACAGGPCWGMRSSLMKIPAACRLCWAAGIWDVLTNQEVRPCSLLPGGGGALNPVPCLSWLAGPCTRSANPPMAWLIAVCALSCLPLHALPFGCFSAGS